MKLTCASVVALALSNCGCGTIASQARYFTSLDEKADFPVYAGTLWDAYFFDRDLELLLQGRLMLPVLGDARIRTPSLVSLAIFFGDGVLCLAADTVVLPLAIGQSVEILANRRVWEQEAFERTSEFAGGWQWVTGRSSRARLSRTVRETLETRGTLDHLVRARGKRRVVLALEYLRERSSEPELDQAIRDALKLLRCRD
jgi:hypothetical protein